jgi:hypothetical protein
MNFSVLIGVTYGLAYFFVVYVFVPLCVFGVLWYWWVEAWREASGYYNKTELELALEEDRRAAELNKPLDLGGPTSSGTDVYHIGLPSGFDPDKFN